MCALPLQSQPHGLIETVCGGSRSDRKKPHPPVRLLAQEESALSPQLISCSQVLPMDSGWATQGGPGWLILSYLGRHYKVTN